MLHINPTIQQSNHPTIHIQPKRQTDVCEQKLLRSDAVHHDWGIIHWFRDDDDSKKPGHFSREKTGPFMKRTYLLSAGGAYL